VFSVAMGELGFEFFFGMEVSLRASAFENWKRRCARRGVTRATSRLTLRVHRTAKVADTARDAVLGSRRRSETQFTKRSVGDSSPRRGVGRFFKVVAFIASRWVLFVNALVAHIGDGGLGLIPTWHPSPKNVADP
jgi:hypothetical protein